MNLGKKQKPVMSNNLEDNIKTLHGLFGDDKTIKVRRFENQKQPKLKCCLFFVDGMVNNVIINQHIMQPIIENEHINIKSSALLETLAGQVIMTNDLSINNDLEAMIKNLLFGDTLLFVDGCDKGLVIPTKGWNMRGIAEPDGEKVMRGPREGFNENLLVNLALLRRKVCNPNLRYKFMVLGKQSNTNACLCYIDGIANPAIVSELENRLSKVNIDAVLSANYVAELIQHSILTPFKVTGGTERPDTVAGKILEGRVALIIDGTPVALIVPHLFIENFQNLDDYYLNFYYATFGRILRFLGFLITTTLPGIYLSLVTFHQELMPPKVLLNISQTREGLPFSTLGEMFVLLLVFELIREGGSKIPSNIGQSLSIVGGLVLGQAAVSAKFVSVPIVIIVALTGITGLMIPYISGPAVMIRFSLLFLAYAAGLYGLLFGVAAVLLHLCSIDCFGIPYISSLTYTWRQMFQDNLMRVNWRLMKYRPRFLAPGNKIRQKTNSRHIPSIFLVLILGASLLSGCGAREVGSLSVVSGVSIDKVSQPEEEDKYAICAEVLNTSTATEEEPLVSARIKAFGSEPSDAFLACNLANNKATYWQHAKLMIIDENLAKTDGISDLLDLILRNYPAKFSGYLALSGLPTAEAVLDLKPQSSNIKAYDLSLYVDTSASFGGTVRTKAYEAIGALDMEGMNILMPVISCSGTEDQKVAKLSGTGVFKEDKLVGTFSTEETLYLLFLRDEVEEAAITVRFDVLGKNNYVLSETGDEFFSVNVKNSRTKFTPALSDGLFSMEASVFLDGAVISSSIAVNMNDPGQKKAIEDLTDAFIVKNCRSVYQKALHLSTDAFGFGARLKKAFPDAWQEQAADWNDEGFGDLGMNLMVKPSLTNSENIGGGLKR